MQLKIKLIIFALLRIKLDYKFRSENKFRYAVQNLIKKVKKNRFNIRLSCIKYHFRTANVSNKNKARHRDRGKSVGAFAELEMNEGVGGPGKIGRREVLGNLEQMRQD